MNRHYKFLLAVALLSSISISAQSRYFVGLNFGPSFDDMVHEDPGGEIVSPWVYYKFNYSINAGYKIWRKLWIESGVTYNNTGEGYGISESGTTIVTDSYISYQIPILISSRKAILNERIGMCLKGGFVLNIPSHNSSGQTGGFGEGGLGVDGQEAISIEDKTTYNWSGLNTLLRVGGELSYAMGKWSIGAGMNYTYGWKDIAIMELTYKRTGREVQEAKIYGRGTQLYYYILCEYRFGGEQS